VSARGPALALIVTLAGAGCARASQRPPGPVDSALVAVAADFDAGDVVEAWDGLQRLADRVTARHRRSGASEVDDLRAVLLEEEKFQREIDSDDPRFFLLPSVLANHRGNCLGLGALMLGVGERLGLPLDGVMVPGHFFVRTREALRNGKRVVSRAVVSLGALQANAEQAAAKAERIGAGTRELEESVARLRRSTAQLAVLRAALAEVDEQLGWMTVLL